MKLLNVPGCLFPGTGGNVKEQTMIVEEQGIGFRTGVRLPSGPPGLVKVSTGVLKLVKLSVCNALNGKLKYKR